MKIVVRILSFTSALAIAAALGCNPADPGPRGETPRSVSADGHDHEGHDHEGHDHAGHDHAGHDHASDKVAVHDHSHWWCAVHGVPEEECGQCNQKLAVEFQRKGDWCQKHNRPDSQCFICHPEHAARFAARYEAKYGKPPPKMN